MADVGMSTCISCYPCMLRLCVCFVVYCHPYSYFTPPLLIFQTIDYTAGNAIIKLYIATFV